MSTIQEAILILENRRSLNLSVQQSLTKYIHTVSNVADTVRRSTTHVVKSRSILPLPDEVDNSSSSDFSESLESDSSCSESSRGNISDGQRRVILPNETTDDLSEEMKVFNCSKVETLQLRTRYRQLIDCRVHLFPRTIQMIADLSKNRDEITSSFSPPNVHTITRTELWSSALQHVCNPRGGRWDVEEDACLKRTVEDWLKESEENGANTVLVDWDDVCKAHNYRMMYRFLPRTVKSRRPDHSRRTPISCQIRYEQFLTAPEWTESQDKRLGNIVHQQKVVDWSDVAFRMGQGFTVARCLSRWFELKRSLARREKEAQSSSKLILNRNKSYKTWNNHEDSLLQLVRCEIFLC